MITWDDVVALAPELAALLDPARTDILALANSYWHEDSVGGEGSQRLRMLRIYLAAHFGTFALAAAGGPGAPAGPVVGESADGLSVQYASPFNQPGFDPLWDGTSYGRLIRLLLRSSPARGPYMF